MYIIRIFSILISCLLLFTSCEKEEEEDLTVYVKFIEPGFSGTCFNGIHDLGKNEIVITDDVAYKELENSLRIESFNSNCDTATLPNIDFNKYSLIGKYTSGGGCDANYDRQIINDKKNNKIIYIIHSEYSGDCLMYIGSMYWALIPKIDKNYSIEFIVINKSKTGSGKKIKSMPIYYPADRVSLKYFE